jgi:hypothetical protein
MNKKESETDEFFDDAYPLCQDCLQPPNDRAKKVDEGV